jgi:predicted SnoaL-like aldol condensation-catalyzing enzyme
VVLALMLGAVPCARAQVVGHPEPLALLASDDATLAANKRLVFDFWRGVVNAGHVELADELLVEGYIQHSPVLPTGRAALKRVFSAVPRLERIPETVSPPLVALVAEGPYVVMALAETVAGPGGAGSYTTTHFNLFRVENGRLAEHWHSVQAAPGPDVPRPEDGGPQPVTGRVGSDQYALLEAAEPGLAWNKRQVFDFWRQVADAGREELVEVYVGAGFAGRSAIMAAGRSGFAAHFSARPERPIAVSLADPLVAMLAEGDLVVQVRMREHAHPSRAADTYTTTLFDMFRVADGRLVEHWDAALKPSPAGG